MLVIKFKREKRRAAAVHRRATSASSTAAVGKLHKSVAFSDLFSRLQCPSDSFLLMQPQANGVVTM